MTVVPAVSAGADILESWGDAVAAALAPYGCKLLRTANLSLTDATDTSITFPSGSVTEELDTHSFHDTGSATARITIPSGGDGYYLIGGCVEFAANATGSRQVWVELNGTAGSGTDIMRATTPGHATVNNRVALPTFVYDLNAGDYVTLNARQNSTGALNIIANGIRFWAVRLWCQ